MSVKYVDPDTVAETPEHVYTVGYCCIHCGRRLEARLLPLEARFVYECTVDRLIWDDKDGTGYKLDREESVKWQQQEV